MFDPPASHTHINSDPAHASSSGHASQAASGQPSQAPSTSLTPRRDGSNNLFLHEQQQQHDQQQQAVRNQPQLHFSASVPSPVFVRAASVPPPVPAPESQPQTQPSSDSRYACFNCMPDIAPLQIPSMQLPSAPFSSDGSTSPTFIDKIRQRLSGGDPPAHVSSDAAPGSNGAATDAKVLLCGLRSSCC